MSLRVATVLYSIAVVAIPVSVTAKFLLGMTGTTWIDPTLLLALAALVAGKAVQAVGRVAVVAAALVLEVRLRLRHPSATAAPPLRHASRSEA